jgi:hypothetical protein
MSESIRVTAAKSAYRAISDCVNASVISPAGLTITEAGDLFESLMIAKSLAHKEVMAAIICQTREELNAVTFAALDDTEAG